MRTATKLAIALATAGSALDIFTTELLLRVSTATIGGVELVFTEQNPLFYILGHTNFLILFTVGTILMAVIAIVCEALYVNKVRSMYVLSVVCVASYGAVHAALGINHITFILMILGVT